MKFFFISFFWYGVIFSQNITLPLNDLNQVMEGDILYDTIFIASKEYLNIHVKINDYKKMKLVILPQKRGEVTIKGISRIDINNSQNVVVEGFIFRDTKGGLIRINNSTNIHVYDNYFYGNGSSPTGSIIRIENGSAENIISNNTFEYSKSAGIVIVTKQGESIDRTNVRNVIKKNHFKNIAKVKDLYPKSNGNGLECIMIGWGFHDTLLYELNTIVDGNLFENIVGDGFEVISNKTSNNEIINNYFINNEAGVSLRSGNMCKVINNYFLNTKKAIRIYGNGHLIENNKVIGAGSGIELKSGDKESYSKANDFKYFRTENISILNNSFSNCITAIQIENRQKKLVAKNILIKENTFFKNNFDTKGIINKNIIIQNSSAEKIEKKDLPSGFGISWNEK